MPEGRLEPHMDLKAAPGKELGREQVDVHQPIANPVVVISSSKRDDKHVRACVMH
jgi:hypothetical protein